MNTLLNIFCYIIPNVSNRKNLHRVQLMIERYPDRQNYSKEAMSLTYTRCGVVFFTSPFHLGGRHAIPFTRNLEGECARGGMNFVSVLPTISHELSYLSYE